jgi:hypothetical protein
MSDVASPQPRPGTVGPDDLKDAWAVLSAASVAALPASVGVGIGLTWLRLHDAQMDPIPVLARMPKAQLALDGAQVLVYVVLSALLAVAIVFFTNLTRARRRLSVCFILLVIGGTLLLLAWPIQQRSDLGVVDFSPRFGGWFAMEEPARWAATAGGGFLLAAALIFRRHRWNDWRFSVAIGVVYASLATAFVFGYLAISESGTKRNSLGPPVVVLLDNPRPESKGTPRRRQPGRLVWATADAVALCVQCEPFNPYRRIIEFPRRRVVWVRVQSRDTPPRIPKGRELKPFG